jgi:GAF domain
LIRTDRGACPARCEPAQECVLAEAAPPACGNSAALSWGYVTVVGSYGWVSDQVSVGFRTKLLPETIQAIALRTGRPARANGERLAKGPYGEWLASLGLRAGVAVPIMVGGRRWGVTVAVTSQEDFPPGTEPRMADFTELAAMAIANAQAEQELRELADTQAALRRLAVLVARGERPEAVFAAATGRPRHDGVLRAPGSGQRCAAGPGPRTLAAVYAVPLAGASLPASGTAGTAASIQSRRALAMMPDRRWRAMLVKSRTGRQEAGMQRGLAGAAARLRPGLKAPGRAHGDRIFR